MAVGPTNTDVVAVEARKAAQLRGATPTFGSSGAAAEVTAPAVPVRRDRVASLTERRQVKPRDRAVAGERDLASAGRPLPPVAQYDELLAHPPPSKPEEPHDHTTMSSAARAGRAGVTEQAADAAVDRACRVLQLTTMRSRSGEVADAAQREHLTVRVPFRGVANLILRALSSPGQRGVLWPALLVLAATPSAIDTF